MELKELSFSDLSSDKIVGKMLSSNISVITAHAEMVFSALQSKAYLDPIMRGDILTADGFGLVRGLNLLGIKVPKISGVDIVETIIVHDPPISLYLFGGKEAVVESAANKLTSLGVKIAGFAPGYNYNLNKVYEDISRVKPQIVLVGIGGSEKQLEIVNEIRDKLGISAITVGGVIDLYAGIFRRAPKLIQKSGLEWLWRMIEDPSRFKKIPKLFGFVVLVLKERFS